jgi:hypothetical protein
MNSPRLSKELHTLDRVPPVTFALLPALVLLASACPSPEADPASPSRETRPAEAGTAEAGTASSKRARDERPVRLLPLAGPLSNADAEVSGLAWHGSDLILLPQHPFRMADAHEPDAHGPDADEPGTLFALARDSIDAFLSGRRDGPLRPRPVTLLAPALEERSPTYDGCEALAFHQNRAYLATEAVADPATGAMRGFLFGGALRGDTLRLDTRRRARLPPQTEAHNMAYEALLAAPSGRVTALHEANGRNVNAHPQAHVFSPTLKRLRQLPFPPLEYRLTDATALDADGRFWVSNYFFPGEREKLEPAPDPLARNAGPHSAPSPPKRTNPVERLVGFRMSEGRIERTSAPPLYLSLRPGTPRNWEGLARLRRPARPSGFLLATDQYPKTLLGFVSAEDVK